MAAECIHIVGLGVTDRAHLTPEARDALLSADSILGSERQLQVIAGVPGVDMNRTHPLPALSDLGRWIEQAPGGGSLVVLASGDPLFYGIGTWFSRHYPAEQLRFYPAVSSLQAACHALGIALQDVEVLSLHGRPVEKLRTRLQPNRKLLILTDQHSTPTRLARECAQAGLGDSVLTLCEALGYPNQRIRRFSVDTLLNQSIDVDPLNLVCLEVRGVGGLLPTFPGIADTSFMTDGPSGQGMITKREVRLAVLSWLQPAPEDVVWDIGAGCGSVSVELAYWNPTGQVHAVECHPDRLACLEANRERFGVVSNLTIHPGRAPEVLGALPTPSRIFIGGSDGEMPGLLEQCWDHLPAGGVLVASAVTESTKQALFEFAGRRVGVPCETQQIAISKGGQLAGQWLYRPNLPVTLFRFLKSVEGRGIQ